VHYDQCGRGVLGHVEARNRETPRPQHLAEFDFRYNARGSFGRGTPGSRHQAGRWEAVEIPGPMRGSKRKRFEDEEAVTANHGLF
jgi:hypothetical protein